MVNIKILFVTYIVVGIAAIVFYTKFYTASEKFFNIRCRKTNSTHKPRISHTRAFNSVYARIVGIMKNQKKIAFPIYVLSFIYLIHRCIF